jgi:hypothetical protein
MTKPTIRIHNIETNEIIDREMTDAEYTVYQADQTAEAARQAELAARESTRQALLSRLGITQEEAQLLLGGN